MAQFRCSGLIRERPYRSTRMTFSAPTRQRLARGQMVLHMVMPIPTAQLCACSYRLPLGPSAICQGPDVYGRDEEDEPSRMDRVSRPHVGARWKCTIVVLS